MVFKALKVIQVPMVATENPVNGVHRENKVLMVNKDMKVQEVVLVLRGSRVTKDRQVKKEEKVVAE